MNRGEPAVFAVGASHVLGEAVAAGLGLALSPYESRVFEDGEFAVRPAVDVADRDVYVVQSLYGDAEASPDEKLCRLLFFFGALKDAGAARLTLLAPYLAYARKDRRTRPNDALTHRYVAQLLEAMGVDRVVTLEAHNVAAFENAFRCRTTHLEVHGLFSRILCDRLDMRALTVMSPDAGGKKRADRLRDMLQLRCQEAIGSALMEKRRAEDGSVSGRWLVGDVCGRRVVIVDDLLSSGTTLARAAEACVEHGATEVYAAVAHGLFSGEANATLAHAPLQRILVTDSIVPRFDPRLLGHKVEVVAAAPLFVGAL